MIRATGFHLVKVPKRIIRPMSVSSLPFSTSSSNSNSSSSSDAAIRRLMGFIKSGSVQPASKPGFAHALQLSFNTIDVDRLSITSQSQNNNNKPTTTLTYRYPFVVGTTPTVGLLTALMDELSTGACFAAGSPSPPGVSVQLQTELLVPLHQWRRNNNHHELDIDIVNHVTKLGKLIAHTRTEFCCPTSHKVLALSSHVKYLPMGNWLLDQVFTNKSLYNMFETLVLPCMGEPRDFSNHTKLAHQVIDDNLTIDQNQPGTATFHVTGAHTNPLGGMHGGCHAMIMETVATEFINSNNWFQCHNITLQSMDMEFMAPARLGSTVEVTCEHVGKLLSQVQDNDNAPSATTRLVRVLIKQGPRLLSEGRLRFKVVVD